jgi:hypothetical protein
MAGPGWSARDYDRIAERFVGWARTEDAIRAAFVIGSRAREDHAADEWADLDILVLTSEATERFRDPGWVSRIGDPWITFLEPTPAGHGTEWRVLFAGGVDVDFALFSVLSATMDLFGEVSRRTAAALGVPCPPAVEEHARALVAQLRSTRPSATHPGR